MATRKTKIKLTKFDVVDYLKSEEDMALYLDACLQEGGDDPAFIAAALGDIARAKGIGGLAGKVGMTRAGLYKALGKDGNPSFGAVLKVMRAMGMELHVSRQKGAA
jgi:probable addiction module antidote protein